MESETRMNEISGIHAIILAAGKGSRMPSPRPKVLQTLLGESMLALVQRAVHQLPNIDRIWTIVGHEADMVRAELNRIQGRINSSDKGRHLHNLGEDSILQAEQLGTGHALQCALPALLENGASRVLIVNGDVPLLTPGMLQRLLAEKADVAFLSLHLQDPASYGRVVRDEVGNVIAIVEAKDYDPATHGFDPHEINTGLYVLSMDAARALLPRLSNQNHSKEYYITDLVKLAVMQGLSVHAVVCDTHESPDSRDAGLALLGVNSPLELEAAEERLRHSIVRQLLSSGVVMHAPQNVRISPFAHIEPGAELFGPCEIYGDSSLAFGVTLESHCVLRNAHISELSRIRSYSHIEDATVGPRCQVGPYARLRPGAVMEEDAHLGNFVEMKKSRLGRGAKANHLTYLGDADIGPGVNIGAGTITCNYDGINKHRTVIGAHSFIGSNTALVAPVTLGEHVLVGAGSVITKDVPDHEMAIARGKQVNIRKK